MSGLKRGDLVWTLSQCYGIVENLRGDEAVLYLGTGERVTLPVAKLFAVTPHAALAADTEEPANFASILAKCDRQPAPSPDSPA